MPYTPEEIARVNKNAMELMESLRPLLAKADPWTPKFAVGQRVLWNGGEPMVVNFIDHRLRLYSVGNGPLPVSEVDLQPYIWSLADLKGFRPLKDGEEYHRLDWTEDMLPEGWRPLLKGEAFLKDDELDHENHSHTLWTAHCGNTPIPKLDGPWFYRTRRPVPPLPDPEREAFEKWAVQFHRTPLSRYLDGSMACEYVNTETSLAWRAWQASAQRS